MRVVQVHHFGPPDVLTLTEQEEPQARPGQVVIAIEATGVGFGETRIRAGKYPYPLPFVPGWEVGGRVIKIGPDVDQSLLGASVVARSMAGGGYAEQIVVDTSNVFPLPAGLSVEQAVGVFLAGQTAVCLRKAMDIKAGETVLITAAAGSVSSLLIQLAKAAGAHQVIGAARGKEKLAVASRLGADVVIDYSEDTWVEQVREVTAGKGADIVLDSVGGAIGRQAFEATANGHGRIGIYGVSAGEGITIETEALARRGVTVVGALGVAMALMESEQVMRTNVDFVLTEAAAGRLTAIIGQAYPLERAAEAHAALEERRTIGKVLLVP